MTKVKAYAQINQEFEVQIPITEIPTKDMVAELKRRGCTAIEHILVDDKLKWEAVANNIDKFSWIELCKMFGA